MEKTLKETRLAYQLTIKEITEIVGIPSRTYLRYEKNEQYGSEIKRKFIIDKINSYKKIDETHGLLTIEGIKTAVERVLAKHSNNVTLCYLFGSYAKGYAKEDSDVDLCVLTTLTGFNFIGLANELSNALSKKIDLLRLDDLKDNFELTKEIMLSGIKIYG